MVQSDVATRSRYRLLVIDDDPALASLLDSVFNAQPYEIEAAYTGAAGLEKLAQQAFSAVLLDSMLPDLAGLEVLSQIKRIDPQLPVLFLTAGGPASVAIEAMKLEAFDCLRKPLDLASLRERIQQACRVHELQAAPSPASTIPAADDGLLLVGECEAMQQVFKAVGRLARQDTPTLIQGEIGTGKESVARALHRHSPRADRPFVVVHCPAFSPARSEQELFGGEGPEVGQPALEQRAQGGTLLLQEISAMPLALQTKLFQSLRSGGHSFSWNNRRELPDYRLIATTSADLEGLAARGEFRADLFYLLTANTIKLPALRQRPGDMPVLVRHLLSNLYYHVSPQPLHPPRVSDEALERLARYSWPGNLDELFNVLKRCLSEGNGNIVLSPTLLDSTRERTVSAHGPSDANAAASELNLAASTDWQQFTNLRLQAGTEDLYAEAVAEMEQKLLRLLLEYTHGNQAHAARILGITRVSLRKKLKSLPGSQSARSKTE